MSMGRGDQRAMRLFRRDRAANPDQARTLKLTRASTVTDGVDVVTSVELADDAVAGGDQVMLTGVDGALLDGRAPAGLGLVLDGVRHILVADAEAVSGRLRVRLASPLPTDAAAGVPAQIEPHLEIELTAHFGKSTDDEDGERRSYTVHIPAGVLLCRGDHLAETTGWSGTVIEIELDGPLADVVLQGGTL